MLIGALRRPLALAALPVLLLGEILTTVAVGSSPPPFRGELRLLADLDRPSVPAANYLEPTPLSRVLAGGLDARYYTTGVPTGRPHLDPRALQNNESMIHGLTNLGGYQAVQLQRYWLFVRRLQRQPMRYNYAIFVRPPPSVSDLLAVGWVIAGSGSSPGDGYRVVAEDGEWTLYRRTVPARASLMTSWTVVRTREDALDAVAAPSFDPSTTAILEDDPEIAPPVRSSQSASISYRSLGNQAARIDMDSPSGGIVVVRNVWDRNWRVTVDGRPGRVLPTNYLVQGIPVGPGRHTIDLRYDDPAVGYGLLGSGVALVALIAAATFARRRERDRTNRGRSVTTPRIE